MEWKRLLQKTGRHGTTLLLTLGRKGCLGNRGAPTEVGGNMYIDKQLKLNVNGVPQFISIRAEKEKAPLLIYLHGGPGDAAFPLVMTYNKMLEQQFTVVIWEQRGAGKSYYKFDGPVTIDIFLNDLYTLVDYLLPRFHQSSVYLVGHSWGSILGLRFVKAYPELVHTYIGCGQVVNMKKSSKSAYEYALAHADKKDLEKLRRIDCSYQTDSWLNDLLFVTRQVVKHKTNFEAQTQYGAPIIFIEGRYDNHVSFALAKEYFDQIETEKQFYWFEESCHFPQWSESDRFNKLICNLLT